MHFIDNIWVVLLKLFPRKLAAVLQDTNLHTQLLKCSKVKKVCKTKPNQRGPFKNRSQEKKIQRHSGNSLCCHWYIFYTRDNTMHTVEPTICQHSMHYNYVLQMQLQDSKIGIVAIGPGDFCSFQNKLNANVYICMKVYIKLYSTKLFFNKHLVQVGTKSLNQRPAFLFNPSLD